MPRLYLALLSACLSPLLALAQSAPTPEPPLRFPPEYPVAYAPATPAAIRDVLERIHGYIAGCTPARLIDQNTGAPLEADAAELPPSTAFERGDFPIVSYEWGVTYAGMLLAAEATGDVRYRNYTEERLEFITRMAPRFRVPAEAPAPPPGTAPRLFRSVNAPRSLDDAGSMAAAFLKAARAGLHAESFRPFIDRYLAHISSGQYRFPDGTLARKRPLADALWLDDLYMSVPALAQMGALTGDARYFDDAALQIIKFHERMFVPAVGLYMHGWIRGMEPHPVFHWARANGWAIVAAAELLSVLPADHPQHAAVLAIYRAHAFGVAATQGGAGLWHQLLDRRDSYAETSASAMFVYALARGINRGWLDALAYGPAVSLGWNAVSQQVNARGQVENTCVGTGMGFDPAFYYHRPVSPYAPHGYGPVLLAGAEMLALRQGLGAHALISDGAVQFAPSPSGH